MFKYCKKHLSVTQQSAQIVFGVISAIMPDTGILMFLLHLSLNWQLNSQCSCISANMTCLCYDTNRQTQWSVTACQPATPSVSLNSSDFSHLSGTAIGAVTVYLRAWLFVPLTSKQGCHLTIIIAFQSLNS